MEALQIIILIAVVVTMIIKEKSKKNKQAKPAQVKPVVKKDRHIKDYEDDSTSYLLPPTTLPVSSIRNAQSRFEEGTPSTLDQLDTNPTEEDLSTTHMTDVKRGIIWSEILHRKY